MNYYEARQRTGSAPAVFDFTRRNDGDVRPEGYCRQKVPCPNWDLDDPFKACDLTCEICHGERWVANPDYCGGHPTPQAAGECFARYIADQGTREETYGDWTGCEALVRAGDALIQCDKPTKKGLASCHPLGGSMSLCDEHRSSEVFQATQPKRIGSIAASY